MDITELLNQKKQAVDAAAEIRNRVYADQNGEWRGDDNAKFDDLMSKADGFTAEIERAQRLDKAARSLSEADTTQGRRSDPQTPNTRGAQPNLERATPHDYDVALRGWLLSGLDTEHVTDAHRNAARRVGANLGGKTMTLRLAPHAMRSLDPRDVAEWEKRAAIGVGSGSIGGYTVADTMMGALEKALLAFGGMRSVATVIRTATGSDMPIPTSDDTSNKGALLAENTQVSEVDITFSQLVLQAYKYSSKSVLVSQEFLQDSSINVNEFIGNALGERIARIQNDNFTTGTGSSQPNGIVTAATSSSVTFTGTATITYDNLVDLVHSVDPAYRTNGKFMFHDGALKMLKKVKVLQYSGDTVGAPLWQPSMVAGQPDMVMGYQYVINQSMTTPATGVKSILFGDFSKYLIRDCRDVTLIRLDERYADYHQVGFLAFARSDGDLLDAGTHPVKYGTQA
jgi:HK97 family phage major capsid protein